MCILGYIPILSQQDINKTGINFSNSYKTSTQQTQSYFQSPNLSLQGYKFSMIEQYFTVRSHIYIHTNIRVGIYMYINTYIYAYTLIFVFVCVCIYICTYLIILLDYLEQSPSHMVIWQNLVCFLTVRGQMSKNKLPGQQIYLKRGIQVINKCYKTCPDTLVCHAPAKQKGILSS